MVAASGTTTIDIFGVGAVVSANVVGITRDNRLPDRGPLRWTALLRPKIAEGKTRKEAMRALKSRISASWGAMVADDRRSVSPKSASGHEAGPGAIGERLCRVAPNAQTGTN